MNCSPSLMSRKVSVQSMRRAVGALALAGSGAGRRSPPTRGTSSRRTTSASDSWSTLSDEMTSKSPSHVATPASSEKMIAPIGNVP